MRDVAIGLFNDSYAPIIDGVTVTVRNYATWLSRTLGPTCVVAPSAPSHLDAEGFPVLRFLSIPTFVHPPYRIGLPGIDVGLRARLRRMGFSIFHAHSPFGAGWAALKAARAAGAPIVATFHSKFRDNLCQAVPFRPIVEAQVRRIADFFASVDQVWVPQESVSETLREYGYRGPYEVVENGIDYLPPPDPSALGERGGRFLGLPEDAVAGLYVGQHILEKNLEFLVRSLPRVLAAVPRFRMAFVGEGCARPRLQRLAAELGLGDRVSFHGKVDDRELLAAVYSRGDLFLFPSRFDNAPLVVREAAAFGTPSILLRGTTAAEVIRDGENGFLADEGSFAREVIRVLESPGERERAARGARASLCRSWEDVVGEVKDRYLALLSHWAA